VPHLWEFYPDFCHTTEEKGRKNLSQVKKNLSQVKKNLSQGKKNISQVKKNLSQVKKSLSQGKKNLSQVKKNLSHSTVYILPKTPTHYKALANPHITKPTHTHTTKQYKTTTVQIKTKCIQEKQDYPVSNVVNPQV
jgi:septation ring formation regulator EzrA